MSESVLSGLKAGPPRLFLSDAELPRLRRLTQEDPLAREYFQMLRREGEAILNAPPVERVLQGWEPTYRFMLEESRKAVHRVYTLGLLYRLTGEERWGQRAVAEMLAAARFEDWNPPHWLDVAEMMNALATGYDWLYHYLTPAQRSEISAALLEKGLKEAERLIGAAILTRGMPRWMAGCGGRATRSTGTMSAIRA